MGTAMCWPLHDRGYEIHLVGTPLDNDFIQSIRQTRVHPKLEREIPPGIIPHSSEEIPQVLQSADLVINGVSSFGVDWFIRSAAPSLQPGVPVLAVTKGLVISPDGAVQTLPDYIQDHLPAHNRGKVSLNAIGGPCIAHELAARRQTGVVFTGHDPAVLEELKSSLATEYYHIWTSTARTKRAITCCS